MTTARFLSAFIAALPLRGMLALVRFRNCINDSAAASSEALSAASFPGSRRAVAPAPAPQAGAAAQGAREDDVREVHRRVNRPRGVHVGLDVHANGSSARRSPSLAVVASRSSALLSFLGSPWDLAGLFLLGVGARRRGLLRLEPLKDEGNEDSSATSAARS